MPATGVLLALLLQAAIVVAAIAGLVRVAGLRAFAEDVRLKRLEWFFGLFAAAIAVQLIVSAFLLGMFAIAPLGKTSLPSGVWRPLVALSLAHHVFMIAALVLALRTFSVPWRSAVAVAPALALWNGGHPILWANGHFVPLSLAEALLTLYLAIASAVNHRRRKTKGALRVAGAFLLIFLGHLGYFLLLHDLARPFWGEALTFAGMLLLVASVPRNRPVALPASEEPA